MLTSIYYCFYIKIYYKIHCSSTLDSFEGAKSEESPVPLIEDLLINEEYINADEHDLKNTLFFYNYGGSNYFKTGQREISLWSAVRKLRLTPSNVGQIIGAIRGNTYSTPLNYPLDKDIYHF